MKSKHKREWDKIKDKIGKLHKKSTFLESSQNKYIKPEEIVDNGWMPKKETFPCLLCKTILTSNLTLRDHMSDEHTKRKSLNVDILAIERFDQLDSVSGF